MIPGPDDEEVPPQSQVPLLKHGIFRHCRLVAVRFGAHLRLTGHLEFLAAWVLSAVLGGLADACWGDRRATSGGLGPEGPLISVSPKRRITRIGATGDHQARLLSDKASDVIILISPKYRCCRAST